MRREAKVIHLQMMPRCPVHGDDWNKMNSWILPATRITHKMPRRTTTSRPNIAGVVWEALAGNPTSDSANVGAVEGWEQAPWPRRFYVNWFECQLDMENEERIKNENNKKCQQSANAVFRIIPEVGKAFVMKKSAIIRETAFRGLQKLWLSS